jgi:hypothetical protein
LITLSAFNACKNSNTGQEAISTRIINNPVTAYDTANTGDLPKFLFDSETYDFGLIIQGEKVSHAFKFRNVGGSDLVITSASASCGCTVPKYENKPVKPEESGEIEVVFDSENREGIQNKSVTVLANTQPNRKILSFTANVVVPNK